MYQYYILTDHISNYSESDEIHVERSTPEYTKSASKYETYLHITPASLDTFPSNNSIKNNFYTRSIFQRNLVTAKSPLEINIAPQGGGLCVCL